LPNRCHYFAKSASPLCQIDFANLPNRWS
jgi:hypothetical protein